MKLSDNIKKIRKENELSQEDFAEELSVSRQSVSKWESGLSYPEMEKILLICKKYNYTVDELLNNKKSDKESKNTVKHTVSKFVDWITKLINLFIRMTFLQKMKFLIEQILYALIFVFGFIIITVVFKYLFIEIIGFDLPLVVFVGKILSSILELCLIAFIIYIYYYLLDSRYVKYLSLDYEDNNEQKEDEPNLDKKKFTLRSSPQIIIRDNKDSKSLFTSIIVSLISMLIKLGLIFIMIFICTVFIVSVVLLVLITPLISNLFLFISLLLILLSIIIFSLGAIILMYKFLLNIKVNNKLILAFILLSLTMFSIGLGLSILSIKNLEVIEGNDFEELKVVNLYDLYSLESIIAYNAENVTYVITESEEISLEFYYSNYLDLSVHNYGGYYNNSFIVYTHVDMLNKNYIITDFYEDLKNNQIQSFTENYNITVYANERNINYIKEIIVTN